MISMFFCQNLLKFAQNPSISLFFVQNNQNLLKSCSFGLKTIKKKENAFFIFILFFCIFFKHIFIFFASERITNRFCHLGCPGVFGRVRACPGMSGQNCAFEPRFSLKNWRSEAALVKTIGAAVETNAVWLWAWICQNYWKKQDLYFIDKIKNVF